MYEDYMQNYFNNSINGYRNTYEQNIDNYPYQMYGYNYNQNFYSQNRSSMQVNELEDCYPEIYNVVYPMVRKVCSKNRHTAVNKDLIDGMVEEVYSNIEANDAVNLNITINNEVRSGSSSKQNADIKDESRQIRRNSGLNDLIRILILRELIGRPSCIGHNCNNGFEPRPPRLPYQRPPFPRYDYNMDF